MTPDKCGARAGKPRLVRADRVRDEVYRQMFLLEERRPGAEMGLAVALLRAWMTASDAPQGGDDQDWLRKVSPICLQMIETARQVEVTLHPCVK